MAGWALSQAGLGRILAGRGGALRLVILRDVSSLLLLLVLLVGSWSWSWSWPLVKSLISEESCAS